jgi:hypothetical protein
MSQTMPEYRFFFWTEAADRIAKVDITDCADDADAVRWAEQVLDANPSYLITEIWKGDRLVERRQRTIGG